MEYKQHTKSMHKISLMKIGIFVIESKKRIQSIFHCKRRERKVYEI